MRSKSLRLDSVLVKRWHLVCVVGCGLVVVCLLARSTRPGIQKIGLVGFTNGVIGTMLPAIEAIDTNHAAAIQQWLASGTNGAVFTVTNRQQYGIDVWPEALIYIDERHPELRLTTPLLNVMNYHGLLVRPGAVATIQVAVLPHQARWKVAMLYRRNSGYDPLPRQLVRAFISPADPLDRMESDWIEK